MKLTFLTSNSHELNDSLCLEHKTLQLFALCSDGENQIRIVDLETKEKYVEFKEVQLKNSEGIVNILKFDFKIRIFIL